MSPEERKKLDRDGDNAWFVIDQWLPITQLSDEDKVTVERARRIQRFLSQPFHVAEVFTGMAGKYVKIADVEQNSTQFYDTVALDPDTSYFYRVRAHRDSYTSYSAYSNIADAITDPYGEVDGDDSVCPPSP